MSAREPVQRQHTVARATPAEVYAVVTDFPAYPRLFPEFKQARVLSTTGKVVRVEFSAAVVIAVRYVLDLTCDADALTVDWTFVEGEIVTGLRRWLALHRGGRRHATSTIAPRSTSRRRCPASCCAR